MINLFVGYKNKIFAEKLVKTVVDRICDVCNESVMIEVNNEEVEECGELKAQWGYGSIKNGNYYHLDLCESCFKVTICALRDVRRGLFMFDEYISLPDAAFGLEPVRSINKD